MPEKYAFDKEGRSHKILPDVKIGNERLVKRAPQLSSGVCCEAHGMVPTSWLRVSKSALVKVCRLCIRQNCQITWAVPAGGVMVEEHSNGRAF